MQTSEHSPGGAGFWIPAGMALALHVGIGLFYVAAGLLAPLWAVVILQVLWLVFTLGWVLLVRRRSWWNLAVPVVSATTWYLVITAGEQLLGWTA